MKSLCFANYRTRYISYFLIRAGLHQYYVWHFPKYRYLGVVRSRGKKNIVQDCKINLKFKTIIQNKTIYISSSHNTE